MTAPVGGSSGRFKLESHDHAGNFLASLPYRNVQYEQFMNDQGQAFRCEVPFRGYKSVTPGNLYPGKHELWFYDAEVSATVPIFAGPLWDATPSSSTGVVSVSAQDPLSYLVKRNLLFDRNYGSGFQPADAMADMLTTANGSSNTYMTPLKVTSNASVITTLYQAVNRQKLTDIFKLLAAAGDGTDYYVRPVGTGGNYLLLYGGLKNPSANPRALEYGGALAGYSMQINAQSIVNYDDFVSSAGVIGNAFNPTKAVEYGMLYQSATSSDLTLSAELIAAASTDMAQNSSAKLTPTIVTKSLTPIQDFDFGDQFTVVIDDEYTQYDGLIRVVGWQHTIGQGDSTTVVIYTSDTAGI